MSDCEFSSAVRPILLGRDLSEIVAETQRAGFEAYRGKQLFFWLYQKGVDSLDRATNLPKAYRAYWDERYAVGMPAIERTTGRPGGTQKILYRLRDGQCIEGVLMRDKGRASLCVSTQAGCALRCQFCLTGLGGFARDLEPGEIVGQVLASRALLGPNEPLNNMVFMGMGEPLLNLEAVIKALRLIVSPQAMAFSSRRATVSTAGVAPGIRKFSDAQTGANLAVSLNATTDEVRDRLMPINRKYPLAELLDACRAFVMPNRRRITFEYVLLRGVNDSPADAKRLVKLVHGIPCKINLILFNRHEALPFQPSNPEAVEAFRAIVSDANYTVAVRHSKGQEIQAACGQLAGHVDPEMLRKRAE
ncbi:MAG: putative dual-specificity RNA methyltransferase RlmN [candidate division BRC1 bacterium ADurb.BinA364]|nr:MAG: putative dual-specificity RNA methyltransferase RlmN [candidate division BRC1 bacterium ADurb.BinA364]